jgi:hypothetical protein
MEKFIEVELTPRRQIFSTVNTRRKKTTFVSQKTRFGVLPPSPPSFLPAATFLTTPTRALGNNDRVYDLFLFEII